MSEVAGRMAPQVGAYSLMKAHGGRGVLLGGVPGVRQAKVVILGGGVAGKNAANIALGMGADVDLLDIDLDLACVLALRHPGRAGSLHLADAAAGARRRSGHRRRADPRREGAQAGRPTSWSRR